MLLPDRTVVKEQSFERELAALSSDPKRADEFVDGAEWALALDPCTGTLVRPNLHVWFLPMTETAEHPGLVIYYTFSESARKVFLLSVQVAP